MGMSIIQVVTLLGRSMAWFSARGPTFLERGSTAVTAEVFWFQVLGIAVRPLDPVVFVAPPTAAWGSSHQLSEEVPTRLLIVALEHRHCRLHRI